MKPAPMTRRAEAKTISAALDAMAEQAAGAWYTAARNNLYATLYLWYTPSSGSAWGTVTVAQDAPSPAHIPASRLCNNLTRTETRRKIRDIIQGLPLLPTD
jgi:hypothetical protein